MLYVLVQHQPKLLYYYVILITNSINFTKCCLDSFLNRMMIESSEAGLFFPKNAFSATSQCSEVQVQSVQTVSLGRDVHAIVLMYFIAFQCCPIICINVHIILYN